MNHSSYLFICIYIYQRKKITASQLIDEHSFLISKINTSFVLSRILKKSDYIVYHLPFFFPLPFLLLLVVAVTESTPSWRRLPSLNINGLASSPSPSSSSVAMRMQEQRFKDAKNAMVTPLMNDIATQLSFPPQPLEEEEEDDRRLKKPLQVVVVAAIWRFSIPIWLYKANITKG